MADIFNLTDTWNAGGTTFAGIKMNVTNTASAAGSKLMDLQVAAASKFNVDVNGVASFARWEPIVGLVGYGIGYSSIHTAANGLLSSYTPSYWGIAHGIADVSGFCVGAQSSFSWVNTADVSISAVQDTIIRRDGAAGTIAQRNSTNPQSFRVYNTYTDAANYERAVFDWSTMANELTIGTQKAGTGTYRRLNLVGSGFALYGSTNTQCIIDTGMFNAELSIAEGTSYINGNNNAISLKSTGKFAWSTNTTNNGGSAYDAALSRSAAGVVEVNNGTAGTGAALKVATLRRNPPVTKTADFSVADTDSYIICNKGSAGVVTLPAAASYTGREISFTNIQAFAWTSASSNVVPRAGGSAGNAILPATDGAWCKLVSDGTNWINLQGTP